jgi:hypothetical protein
MQRIDDLDTRINSLTSTVAKMQAAPPQTDRALLKAIGRSIGDLRRELRGEHEETINELRRELTTRMMELVPPRSYA